MVEMMAGPLPAFWAAIDAEPENFDRYLVAADACAELANPVSLRLEFALRWMAGRKKRPYQRPEVKRFPWLWMREQDQYLDAPPTRHELRKRACCRIHRKVFDGLWEPTGRVRYERAYRSWIEAVDDLAKSLDELRRVVSLEG